MRSATEPHKAGIAWLLFAKRNQETGQCHIGGRRHKAQGSVAARVRHEPPPPRLRISELLRLLNRDRMTEP